MCVSPSFIGQKLFVFGSSGVWTQSLTTARQVLYHLSHSTSLFFVMGFFQDRVLRTICLGWSRTSILLLSASWVVGLSHWRSLLSPCGDIDRWWTELGHGGIALHGEISWLLSLILSLSVSARGFELRGSPCWAGALPPEPLCQPNSWFFI
jgi:hypothetical protein